MPKSDNTQERYIGPIMSGAVSLSVPPTYTDLERTGIIIEALCAESFYTVTRAYYNSVLTGRICLDEESSDMLDIIFNEKRFDLGLVYNFGGGVISEFFENVVIKGFTDKNYVLEEFENLRDKIEAGIQKTRDKFWDIWD
jgi:hypothetical protein